MGTGDVLEEPAVLEVVLAVLDDASAVPDDVPAVLEVEAVRCQGPSVLYTSSRCCKSRPSTGRSFSRVVSLKL